MDAEGSGERAGGGDVIGELHAEKMVHGWAEGEFDAEGHFGGECGLAMEKVRECGATDLEDGRCFGDGEAEGFGLGRTLRRPLWRNLYVVVSG